MLCLNSASPLLLPWTNVTVSQDGEAITRGIEVALGTPKQVFSLIPSIGDNDMFVFNIADCISASNDTCIAERGGVFDSSRSNTYELTTQSAWNGTYEVTQGSYIYFNDELNVGYGGIVHGYPVFMDQNGVGSFGALPLAANSTFLEAVVAADLAPSRAFGLWTGSRSIDNPVDGSLVVGGYDTARVEGSFTTFPTFPNCATCVVVTNMTYEYLGGSASLFSSSTEHLQVGLEPFAHTLEVPQDVFENFAKVSNGTYSPQFGLLVYDPADPLLGNLSITLQNGYTTTIPAEEIFSLPRRYDKVGTYTISNDSVLLSGIQNYSTPNYLPNWGVPFLTMNYLLLNYDMDEFKLAPAYRDPYDSSEGALITPACSGLAPTSITSSPTASPTTAVVTHTPTPSPPSKSHTGAIVGGAVGGVVVLALILGLLFFLSRRRKGAAAAAAASTPAPTSAADKGDRFSAYTSTSPTEVSELPQQGKNSGLVSQWLAKDGNADDEGVMSPTVKRPFEMPTHNFE